MISGRQKAFCDGIVSGLNQTEAYSAAYPKSTAEAARKHALRLVANGDIQDEIARQRAAAEQLAGSSVMTLVEKRRYLARVVRARLTLLPDDSDLWNVTGKGHRRIPDKLAAIKLDNDLAGSGSEAGADDALTEMLKSIIK